MYNLRDLFSSELNNPPPDFLTVPTVLAPVYFCEDNDPKGLSSKGLNVPFPPPLFDVTHGNLIVDV